MNATGAGLGDRRKDVAIKSERLAEIKARDTGSEDTCMHSSCGEYNCPCHYERAELLAEIDRLQLLVVRKSEALAIVASPSMWDTLLVDDEPTSYEWCGTVEFADPMAWAAREAAATEPDDR